MTGRSWAVASYVAVSALSLVAIAVLSHGIQEYDAGYAAAARGVSATVVRSSGSIEVEWRGSDGTLHRQAFSGGDTSQHPVGSTLPIRISAADPDLAFPEDRTAIDENSLRMVGIFFLVIGLVVAAVFWLPRFVRWGKAAQARAKRCHAQVWYQYAPWRAIRVPWLSIVDGDRTYYQLVLWQPWVPSLSDRVVVDVRRFEDGPFVVDVPGYGRLWPSGSAKAREPLFVSLERRRASRFRLSRIAALVVISGVSHFSWAG